MATAINSPARPGSEIKLGPAPQTFALKFTTGKNLGDSQFPPFLPRVLFTAVDDRKLFLGTEDASDFEHALLDLGIRAGEDFVRVTKPRGRGIRVERVPDQDETKLERDLRESIDMQRARTATRNGGNETAAGTAASQAVKEPTSPGENVRQRGPAASLPLNGPTITPQSAKLCACFMASIDAVSEAQAYADRRGLKITFTSEDVRATAISAYIQTMRDGAR